MSTNSEGAAAARPGRGKNQTPQAAGASGAGDTAAAGPEREQPERRHRARAAVPAGWGRYLVAARPARAVPAGVTVLDPGVLSRLLAEDEQVMVLAEIPGARVRGLSGLGQPGPACPAVTAVAMPAAHAAQLAANPALVCELDAPLVCASANPMSAIVPAADPALAVPLAQPETLMVQVRDQDGNPVPDVHVWALGTAFPAHARSSAAGTARIELVADTVETLRGLYLRPTAGFWPARVPAASLPGFDGAELTVTMRSLTQAHAGFPTAALAGWGASALGLGQVPPTFRGHGVKVAVLDSGIAADHPMLKHAVKGGADFTGEDAWMTDGTGQGTGCAGVIAASDTGTGTAGIAAEADLFAVRLFPHGRVADLLAALDWCAEHDIDLAQLNLSCPPSLLVEWKLADAHDADVAVIAPAGDSGTITAFPAAAPTVIAVGALAHPDTDPDTHLDTPTARTAWSGPYTPAFTPIGAELAAPGTAIITTAAPGEFAIADGTAIAASHITGLAALLLAHHEQLRPAGSHATGDPWRGPTRPDQLAALLRAASQVPAGCDPSRSGAGLPNAAAALASPIPVVYAGYAPAAPGAGRAAR